MRRTRGTIVWGIAAGALILLAACGGGQTTEVGPIPESIRRACAEQGLRATPRERSERNWEYCRGFTLCKLDPAGQLDLADTRDPAVAARWYATKGLERSNYREAAEAGCLDGFSTAERAGAS